MTWAEFTKFKDGQTPFDWFGGWCRKLAFGTGYLDGEDEA